ncbi:unnamed protein product [Fusarium langsethiae]|nr:unnamed protein product [Fusarium langsethiae]
MAEAPAKRQKVGQGSQAPDDTPSFEDFAPDGDVVFIVQGKTRVRVHSAVMKCAYSVFAAMLKPNFKEGRALAESGDTPVEIPLPEDDSEAFGWVCRALHRQADTRLWKPTLTQLASIWLLVDKYNLKGSMQLSPDLWTSESIEERYSDHAFWIFAVTSLKLREAEHFETATRELILKSETPFITIASTSSGFTTGVASSSDINKLAAHFRDLLFATRGPRLAVIRSIISGIQQWARSPGCKAKGSTCAKSMRSVQEKASYFFRYEVWVDGLCLDCFIEKPCVEHGSDESDE